MHGRARRGKARLQLFGAAFLFKNSEDKMSNKKVTSEENKDDQHFKIAMVVAVIGTGSCLLFVPSKYLPMVFIFWFGLGLYVCGKVL